MAGNAKLLGIYGFGAAGHIVAQIARWQGRSVYAFTRSGDIAAQDFSLRLGAAWAGASDQLLDAPLDAAIIYAPAGELVPAASGAVRKGGKVVCVRNPHERHCKAFLTIFSGKKDTASVGRQPHPAFQDGLDFLKVVPQAGIRTQTTVFPLHEANEVLQKLRTGQTGCRGPQTIRFIGGMTTSVKATTHKHSRARLRLSDGSRCPSSCRSDFDTHAASVFLERRPCPEDQARRPVSIPGLFRRWRSGKPPARKK